MQTNRRNFLSASATAGLSACLAACLKPVLSLWGEKLGSVLLLSKEGSVRLRCRITKIDNDSKLLEPLDEIPPNFKCTSFGWFDENNKLLFGMIKQPNGGIITGRRVGTWKLCHIRPDTLPT